MFAFLAAASGSLLGAFMGSTPMIIAAESAVGIKEGGRTGLTAITTGLCFLAALFFAPLLQASRLPSRPQTGPDLLLKPGLTLRCSPFQKVPAAATAPVLVLVGVMMMGESSHIGWGQMTTAVPAFLTIVMQPFTFSISHGIYAGKCRRHRAALFRTALPRSELAPSARPPGCGRDPRSIACLTSRAPVIRAERQPVPSPAPCWRLTGRRHRGAFCRRVPRGRSSPCFEARREWRGSRLPPTVTE